MHQDLLTNARQKLCAEAFAGECLTDADPAGTEIIVGLPVKTHAHAAHGIAMHRAAIAWARLAVWAHHCRGLRAMGGRHGIEPLAGAIGQRRAPRLAVQHGVELLAKTTALGFGQHHRTESVELQPRCQIGIK